MGAEEAERLDLLLGTPLRHVTALAERPAEEGRLPGPERRQEAPGSNLGRVGGRFKTRRPPPFSSSVVPLAPLLKFLCSKEGSGEGGETSELLQAAVHLPFALLPGPGPALGAEFLQVFFKVLVVHGPVAGRLAVRLAGRQDKVWAHWASHAHSCSLPAGGHKALLGRGGGAVLGPFCAQGKPPDPGQETAMTTS